VELLYDAAQAITGFMDSSPPLPVALLCLAIAAIPVTLVHELGHAMAGRLLLGSDVEVRVGHAGKMAELRLGQVAATVHVLSQPGRLGGATTFDDSRARVQDVLWVAVAGPLASLAGLVLAAILLSTAPTTGLLHDLLWAAVLGGAFGVLNLVPFAFQERRDGPPLRTDGRLALDALKVARELR
jgi:hypothetical protein